MPDDYRIGIVAASNTGAVEMALWSLLGPRRVDIAAWYCFSNDWATDVVEQLKLPQARCFSAPAGELPNLAQIDFDHDVVFRPEWHDDRGARSKRRFHRSGSQGADHMRCDLGGFRASARLRQARCCHLFLAEGARRRNGAWRAHSLAARRGAIRDPHPSWPLPKIFRLTKGRKLNEGLFKGATINTPSLLCLEDYLDALNWAKSIGGLDALIARADANAATLADWVEKTPAFDFLAKSPATRSNTSVCLKFADPEITALPADQRSAIAKDIVSLVEKEGARFDFNAYRDSPPGLRIWCGATVEVADIARPDSMHRLGLRRGDGKPRHGHLTGRRFHFDAFNAHTQPPLSAGCCNVASRSHLG